MSRVAKERLERRNKDFADLRSGKGPVIPPRIQIRICMETRVRSRTFAGAEREENSVQRLVWENIPRLTSGGSPMVKGAIVS